MCMASTKLPMNVWCSGTQPVDALKNTLEKFTSEHRLQQLRSITSGNIKLLPFIPSAIITNADEDPAYRTGTILSRRI